MPELRPSMPITPPQPAREARPVHRQPREQGITLGISRSVTSVIEGGHRVRYPEDGVWVIPETLVLRRWRRKTTTAKETCCGFRLPPQTWHVAALCGGQEFWRGATVTDVEAALVRVKRLDRTLRAPTAPNLLLLVKYVDTHQGALLALLDQHRNRLLSPGVPDLFLFRRISDGRVSAGRFVEVKKPEEAISDTQFREIAFLRRLTLKAGVVRLVEQW
jgi:hypothetical protein